MKAVHENSEGGGGARNLQCPEPRQPGRRFRKDDQSNDELFCGNGVDGRSWDDRGHRPDSRQLGMCSGEGARVG